MSKHLISKASRALLIALLTIAPVLAAPVQPPPPPGFDAAVAEFKARHYRASLEKFKEVQQIAPNHVLTHYYKALAYQAINQIKCAEMEYKWLYQNSKDNKLRYNSWIALKQIEKWSNNRAYTGQGNNFARRRAGPGAGGGGGGGGGG
jgi:tetratricopeptide (TPR) repeat protein